MIQFLYIKSNQNMSAYQNNTQMNMSETCQKATAMDGKAWLAANWSVMRVADVNWTMERGEFPSYVKDYICNSGDWIKVNNENGGTYCEKIHFEQSYKKNMIARGWTPPESQQQDNLDSNTQNNNTLNKVRDPVTNVKQEFNNGMDEINKAALKVLQTEGTDAAVKHMFTDDKTGRQLSYSEMRSRYG